MLNEHFSLYGEKLKPLPGWETNDSLKHRQWDYRKYLGDDPQKPTNGDIKKGIFAYLERRGNGWNYNIMNFAGDNGEMIACDKDFKTVEEALTAAEEKISSLQRDGLIAIREQN